MKQRLLEVCVDSVKSARAAEKGGASRIELCGNLLIGGTTPSYDLIELVKTHVHIPIHVLIRPRYGDFCYSDIEVEEIKRSIIRCREMGVDGVVIGILLPDGRLDEEKMKTLIALARPMHVTLHRAIDVCVDPFEALETAITLGMDTILTSGQKNTANEGNVVLKKLVEQAAGRITIMAGSGIGEKNIGELAKSINAPAYHMSGKIQRDSPMCYRHPEVSMGLPLVSEYVLFETDAQMIERAREILDRM